MDHLNSMICCFGNALVHCLRSNMDSDGSENEDVNDEEEDHQTKQKNCPNKSWYFIHHSTIKGKRFSAYLLLAYTY